MEYREYFYLYYIFIVCYLNIEVIYGNLIRCNIFGNFMKTLTIKVSFNYNSKTFYTRVTRVINYGIYVRSIYLVIISVHKWCYLLLVFERNT